MKKITLLFSACFLLVSYSSIAQITMEVLAFPTTFTVDANDAAVYGPAVGENPLVIKLNNVPDATLTTQKAPAPIRQASAVITGLGATVIPASGDFTGLLGDAFNPGGANFGFTNLHQTFVNPASGTANYIKTDNGDGTFDAVLIHTRFTQATTYVEGTDYIVVQRLFLAVPNQGALSVKSDGAGGYEIAAMTYEAALTIETEAELLAKASAVLNTLGVNSINTTKLAAFYSLNMDAVVIKDNLEGDYSIFDLTGKSVLKGEVSKQINVETLNSGMYILSTENGFLKFVK